MTHLKRKTLQLGTKLVVLTIFLLMMGFVSANAQTGCSQTYPVDPCYPDCPNSQWSSIQTYTVTFNSNCKVKVEYVTRHACNTWWDVQIVSYQFTQVGGCPFNYNDPDAAMEAILFQLLKDNPMGFPEPSPVNCTTSWRAANGTCWRRAGDCYIPCDDSGCCLTEYRICIDSSGNKTVTKTGVIGGGTQCPPSPDPDNPCQNVCN